MHGGWQFISPTLLVEVEESLLKRWVALYALTRVWRRGEREKHTCVLARLASPAGPGRAGRGEAMGADTRRAREWSIEIWPNASQVRGFLLSFIFAMSPCLICFNRDRPSRL
jgi:hypothetical protein